MFVGTNTLSRLIDYLMDKKFIFFSSFLSAKMLNNHWFHPVRCEDLMLGVHKLYIIVN